MPAKDFALNKNFNRRKTWHKIKTNKAKKSLLNLC